LKKKRIAIASARPHQERTVCAIEMTPAVVSGAGAPAMLTL
jgi:hypothetical protein